MNFRVEDQFTDGINPIWEVAEVGNGKVTSAPGALWLTTNPAQNLYSNAQIADYTYAAYNFRWSPPVRMTVTARCEGQASALKGTAGFGFWNHPFSPDSRRLPRLPQAIWFFFSAPPSNMALAQGVPGFGWKAATIDATGGRAKALAPFSLPAMLLMRRPSLYAKIWPQIQHALKIEEKLLDLSLLETRHTYTIDWRADGATFAIDGATVFESTVAPRGKCGFVAWIDNQYAVVTPQGEIKFGIIALERVQSLILENVLIESLE
ncbi:MAG: hypothetical protein ABI700_08035 [Chloroflexota bacterium]